MAWLRISYRLMENEIEVGKAVTCYDTVAKKADLKVKTANNSQPKFHGWLAQMCRRWSV